MKSLTMDRVAVNKRELNTPPPWAPYVVPVPDGWRQGLPIDDYGPCREHPGTPAVSRHGYCSPCRTRWADHGYPPSGPPPRQPGRRPNVAFAGFDLFTEMDQPGVRDAEIAAALGVCRRTLQRWRVRKNQLIAEGKLNDRTSTSPPRASLKQSAGGAGGRA